MGARASARAWLPHGRAPRPRLCCTASLSVTRALIGATSIARFAPMNAPVRYTQRQIKTHKKTIQDSPSSGPVAVRGDGGAEGGQAQARHDPQRGGASRPAECEICNEEMAVERVTAVSAGFGEISANDTPLDTACTRRGIDPLCLSLFPPLVSFFPMTYCCWDMRSPGRSRNNIVAEQ